MGSVSHWHGGPGQPTRTRTEIGYLTDAPLGAASEPEWTTDSDES